MRYETLRHGFRKAATSAKNMYRATCMSLECPQGMYLAFLCNYSHEGMWSNLQALTLGSKPGKLGTKHCLLPLSI